MIMTAVGAIMMDGMVTMDGISTRITTIITVMCL
jgi:hypothetical protein